MPDMKTIQDQVGERLTELEELIAQLSAEFEQLKQISGMLESTNGRASAAAKPPAPAHARRGRAAARPARAATKATAARPQRGGNRAQQALDLIAAKPGLSAAELAESMGMKRNYLYRVLPALEKDGRITKQGRGYHPAGDRTPQLV
jgi:predicted Rossmann fold nucleotide-binding protein DprA/Smf involved in DNA uptake